ncbi:TPA: tRNA (N6-isopentenyl adenosine(37)-C2)-methylthiotransferase MiaB, partial [Candidatus Galligastranaerophilus gallistercoris]|nr:tRNA (N6-isopentenyl adenosine(37)-C2)-methylthiotransferase MiaB [Candidatus Galligastranaerophilus gallistercoris]
MESKNKKLYIETLGCQMNKSDSERIKGIMSHFGYIETGEDDADFLIVNTCSIRKLSEDKAYSKLGNWGARKKRGEDIKIGICGCVAQQEKENLLKKFPYIDLIFGTHNIYELPNLLKEEGRICAITNKPVEEKEYNIIRTKGINAWLPIMEGCNNFCTYCVVPYTRGRERSRTIENIIKEAKEILSKGYKEITLLGQNVDSWGKDLKNGLDFADVLYELDKLEGDFRIRFTTSYPTDITDKVINAVKNGKKICECFHIPMQSGNDRILKMMNRRYNVEEYTKIVRHIQNEIDNVTVTSDFIAGFPSETEEEFQD